MEEVLCRLFRKAPCEMLLHIHRSFGSQGSAARPEFVSSCHYLLPTLNKKLNIITTTLQTFDKHSAVTWFPVISDWERSSTHLVFLRQLGDLLHITFVGNNDERLHKGGLKTSKNINLCALWLAFCHSSNVTKSQTSECFLTLLMKRGRMLLKSSSCCCRVWPHCSDTSIT